ncbi:MAG TPA: EAL domain-containing protein [Ilumatobacteraceae bacterium]|nr:EAL domain-containing protein [Ilumatobacteraceae bacterium]HRB03480.1 EAL domain-containing protein [Ilumatobacteraceae bacterium]
MADITELLPSLPIGLFQADRDGRVNAANAAFGALVQVSAASPVGAPPWANAHPGDRASAELTWRRSVEADVDVKLEFRVWHGESRMTWVRIEAQAERDPLGMVTGYAGIAIDHTESVGQHELLDRLSGVVGATDDAVLILDRNGSPVYTNEAARRLFGVEHELDLIRDPAARGLLQAIRDQVPREAMASSQSTKWSGEVGFRGPDGLDRTLDIDLLLNRSADGVIDYWGGVVRDITATKHLQSELTRQANHDPLTGLPNRLLLLRTAADALESIRGTRQNVAILFLDVDRLKDVNDTVGHEIGDALLAQVAHRVAHATRPSDVVARIGGDEFVVLCDGGIDEHSALDLAERIRGSLSGRIMVHGVEVDLSVSVGVAVGLPAHVEGISGQEAAIELLRNADIAMYQAKRRGRSRCELYTEVMRAESRQHKVLSNQLERALAGGQLRLAYQPIISTHSGRVAGAEALLRWDHPEQGTLLPAQFLHLAEESGVIVPIGEWVIRQACLDTRAWLDAGLVDRGFSVHVNIAARQLAEGTFVERVLATVRQMELNPHQLTLDFDENTLNDRQPGNLRAMQALRRFGVQVALDNFGTGVSSLTALRSCEADVLKLDGTVARMLGTSGDDDPIVRAIIQLAHALDMQVVAEWVTSADQLRRLRVLGCDLVQGHLLGEPTAADVFGARTPR